MPDPINGKLSWDADGQRLYETGVDHGVVYPKVDSVSNPYPHGYAWNGLTAVNERPSGAENNAIYADNIKYLNLRSNEIFDLTVEAYTYPDEFAQCDGSIDVVAGVRIHQQTRKPFGFSYRTQIGNDNDGADHGYKLHLVYNCDATPSEKNHQTINESPEAINFSWEFGTTPVIVEGFKPVAHLEIDSTKVDPDDLASFEAILYGTNAVTGTNASDGTYARLPLPAEVFSHFGYTPPAG